MWVATLIDWLVSTHFEAIRQNENNLELNPVRTEGDLHFIFCYGIELRDRRTHISLLSEKPTRWGPHFTPVIGTHQGIDTKDPHNGTHTKDPHGPTKAERNLTWGVYSNSNESHSTTSDESQFLLCRPDDRKRVYRRRRERYPLCDNHQCGFYPNYSYCILIWWI